MIYKNIDQVVITAVAFMLLFTAFMTCQNFASKVLQDYGFESIGFVSVAILYLFFAISSFFSSNIVQYINNAKISMALGALCYSFWILSFLLPAYFAQFKDTGSSLQDAWYMNKTFIKGVILTTAGINGIGAGILWVA